MGFFEDILKKKPYELLPEQQKSYPTPVSVAQPKEGFFTSLIKKIGGMQIPKALEPSPQLQELAQRKTELAPETKQVIQFGKEIGRSIARSFIAVGAAIGGIEKPSLKNTYTPKTEIEKKIFGTDKPIGFKSIGEEILAIGGEDFKQKWGSYSIPIGMVIAGLDVTPIGWGKKDALKIASKTIAKTDDVAKIVKSLKLIFKGTDEELGVLAKSLTKVNKEDEVLKIIQQAGKAKVAPKIVPEAIKGVSEAIPAEKGIIPPDLQPLTQEARKLDFVKPEPQGVKAITESPINKLIKAIDESIPLRGEQAKLYSQELARRTARVAAMGEKVGGESGFYAQLGQLKGELPKKAFEAIRKQFTQKEADLLFNTIEKTKTLLPLEKVVGKGALQKLFKGEVITKNEIRLLQESFPKELIDVVMARKPLLEKITNIAGEILNVPRTIMASVDLSAPFRQGVFMLGRPKQFFLAFKDMFKFAVSEKAYQGLIEGIKTRPTYLKMKQGGLALTEIGGQLSKREEAFMGQLAEKIPLFGSLVRASNRAYTGFLNKLRADIFDNILIKAKIAGKDVDGSLLNSLSDFINAGTGRGKFGLKETGILPKSMEKAAPVMNAVFFSPRLMASRLNLLNPYFYYQLDPFVRKEALKTLFADTAIFGSLYGLWKLNGGDVGVDPRNADFGKLKVGNTRYDVLGGFQQYIKLASQLITGEIVSSTTGRTITLGEGYKPLTRQEIILRFFENKTSPIASFIVGLLKGQTAIGEDFDMPAETINRFIPMVVQDLYDISQEDGAEGLLYGLPAIFGVGVQTYGKQELVSGASKIGEPTTQIRPVPELAEKIRELVLGQLPLGTSKSFSVEAYFDQLSNLPREEAADIFDEISKSNPELAKKLYDVVKEKETGITVKDKDLKSKGVASGDRVLAIKKELDKLKTKEEKANLWEDYTKKGVITKEVARQLLILLK